MIILGIDPGYAITGFGLIKYTGNNFTPIDYGMISTPAGMAFHKRLVLVYDGLMKVIETYTPDAIAVEEIFFSKNTKTAINVGHGRGVAILAAAKSGVDVFEYTPLQVKQAVVGFGRAEKKQVQQMIKVLLKLKEIPKPDDVADALAIAICHAHNSKTALNYR
jgi:crossover junction endodeoxyribonuclease RuvC